MSDIVEKLRSQIGDDVSQVYDKEALFRAAADEISLLRAACAEWADVSQRNYQRAKAAEAALAPFAALFANHHATMKDDHPVFAIDGSLITAGDLRRARAALAADSGAADA